MHRLTQPTGDRRRQRLLHAAQPDPLQRLLAPGRATTAPGAGPGSYAQLEIQTRYAP